MLPIRSLSGHNFEKQDNAVLNETYGHSIVHISFLVILIIFIHQKNILEG